MGSVGSTDNFYDVIHKYQQVSWEGMTTAEKQQLSKYIDTQPDVTQELQRGMVVDQSVIDDWIDTGTITFDEMSSWTTGGAQEFANVSKLIDSENGKRSVILVSTDGLPLSANLPRTNSYDEKEVLTKVKQFDILNARVIQTPYYFNNNYSPTITIIQVKRGKK